MGIPSRTRSPVAALAWTLAICVLPVRAAGQPLWGELAVPGGAAAVRQVLQLGGSAGRLDASLAADFVRRYTVDHLPDAIAKLNACFAMADIIRRGRTEWPDGIALPTGATSPEQVERLRSFLGDMGLTLKDAPPEGYSASLGDWKADDVRVQWLLAASMDRTTIVEDLNARRPVILTTADSAVPLPLPDYWATDVFKGVTPSASAVLGHPSTALLYLGLLSLDDATLQFFAERPRTLAAVRTSALGSFAAFGRSLVIRDNRVIVPGGPGTEALWEHLVGAGPSDPDRFIPNLLQRDEGRLAYFYDTVSRLPAAQQAFALGASLDGGARSEAVDHIFQHFVKLNPEWTVADRPFFRPRFDAALALLFVDVRPDGLAGPDWWPALLDRVWSSREWPATERGDLKSTRADALWLLGQVFAEPAKAVNRFQLVRFLQRSFATVPATGAHDLGIALRARRDMPALAMSLERMGVFDPSVFATVATAAHDLTEAGDRDRVIEPLGRWQAALALLEQVQRRVHLSPDRLYPLVTSLAALASGGPNLPRGAIATWVTEALIPTLRPATAGTAHPDERAIFLAFATPASGAATRFSWEGLEYVIDIAGPVARDALAIRNAGAAPRFQDLFQIQDLQRQLEHGLNSIGELHGLVQALSGLESSGADVRDVIGTLQKVKDQQHLGDAARAMPALGRAVDSIADAVLRASAYALAVSPTTQTPMVFGEAWRVHALDSSPETSDRLTWKEIIWRLPQTEPRRGGGSLLRGSLLGLDVPLSDSQLPATPMLATEGMPQVGDEARAALVRSLVYDTPGGWMGEDAASVLDGLRAGRGRFASWHQPDANRQSISDALRKAGVDESRTNEIVWQLGRTPDTIADVLTPAETYWLGSGKELPPAWNASSSVPNGCLCLMAAATRSADTLRSRGPEAASLLTNNVKVYLTEEVSRMNLPPLLVPLMMPRAMQVWLAHVQQYGPGDWEAFAAWPRHSSSAEIEDVLLFLVSEGIITSPSAGGETGHRP